MEEEAEEEEEEDEDDDAEEECRPRKTCQGRNNRWQCHRMEGTKRLQGDGAHRRGEHLFYSGVLFCKT